MVEYLKETHTQKVLELLMQIKGSGLSIQVEYATSGAYATDTRPQYTPIFQYDTSL